MPKVRTLHLPADSIQAQYKYIDPKALQYFSISIIANDVLLYSSPKWIGGTRNPFCDMLGYPMPQRDVYVFRIEENNRMKFMDLEGTHFHTAVLPTLLHNDMKRRRKHNETYTKIYSRCMLYLPTTDSDFYRAW
jgi:hypothetical protein